ncbi:MAG: hypothetical protein HRT35_22705 [Algicola sp.]|nr:hypothetical protein [Algicola sp.]
MKDEKRYITNKTTLGTLMVTLVLLLSGCATKVEVSGNFPTPVFHQMPLTVGVYYPPTFSQYTYHETNENRSDRTFGIGSAQVKLFQTILPSIFKSVVPMTSVNTPNLEQPVDLVLTMTVDDFQYTVPGDTRIDMYEVWIKYNMQLFDPQGQLIADWILTAYGKSPTAMLKSEGAAINEAMIVALRDAGAGFAMSFDKVPEIRQWLQHRANSQI